MTKSNLEKRSYGCEHWDNRMRYKKSTMPHTGQLVPRLGNRNLIGGECRLRAITRS